MLSWWLKAYISHNLQSWKIVYPVTLKTISRDASASKNLSCGDISNFCTWKMWRNLNFLYMWINFKFLHMTDVEKSEFFFCVEKNLAKNSARGEKWQILGMYQIFHCLQTYKFNHLCYNFYSKRNSFENMCGRNFLAKRQSQEDKRESVKTCLITFLCLNDHPDYSPKLPDYSPKSPDDPSGILSQFFYINREIIFFI